MAYFIQDQRIGVQPIATTETAKSVPLGTIVTATDPIYGTGEFIYLTGIGSTTVGSIVTYNTTTFTTALAPVGTAKPQPVAIAMSANVAGQYGWYQIGGVAVAKKTSSICLVAGNAIGVLTIGLVATTASLKEVQGAIIAATASVATGRTTVQVMLDRPHMQGRVT